MNTFSNGLFAGSRGSAPSQVVEFALLAVMCAGLAGAAEKKASVADCSFQANPPEFLARQSRTRQHLFQSTLKAGRPLARDAGSLAVPASEIPLRNFIDREIFGAMALRGVPSARLSSDEEFFRRVNFDLAGALPAPAEVREFLADPNPSKRDDAIDRLLYSSGFRERWAMWFGDLLQNVAFPSNFDRQYAGRNAFHEWIRRALDEPKSLKDIAYEAITGVGNTFQVESAASNYPLNGKTPMGPIQDTYDTMLNRAATTFLGLSYYDCLLCHNGRGHLEQVSLWGAAGTRLEAQQMAAFFARLNMPMRNLPVSDPFYRSFDVSDRASGNYDLNTNYGNRPDRTPYGPNRFLTPVYRVTGATPTGGNWREAFADNMVADSMFALNFANRLWKEFFNLPLVDPVDGLDPARLDPSNPPPAPWTLQATHPELLQKLAIELVQRQFSLREFIRFLVRSSAYQLSSRYDGNWKYEHVTLFARHYPRRLEGEEVHDAIMKATGLPQTYTLQSGAEPVSLAMRLPEPVEPRNNGAVLNFLNVFLRGNRDTVFRSQNGSILQQLALMNDSFVLSRVRVGLSPTLLAVSRLESNEEVVDEIFLLFLSRRPSALERETALKVLAGATTPADRNAAIEDLAWVCINKVEFIFSY